MSSELQEQNKATFWILVQFKLGQLERAKRELSRQGFVLFCPLKINETAPGNTTPMLKSYAFLKVTEASAPLKAISRTGGVQAVVGPSLLKPSHVRSDIVEAIQVLCDENDVFQFDVVDADGPASFLGGTAHISDEERAYLLLSKL